MKTQKIFRVVIVVLILLTFVLPSLAEGSACPLAQAATQVAPSVIPVVPAAQVAPSVAPLVPAAQVAPSVAPLVPAAQVAPSAAPVVAPVTVTPATAVPTADSYQELDEESDDEMDFGDEEDSMEE